jgi:uroporphyrinogen-III synthase
MGSTFPAARRALIARPQWDWSSPIGSGSDKSSNAAQSASVPNHNELDPRLIAAPLQHLTLCAPDKRVLNTFRWASKQWLVLTSPASVQALDQWLFHTGVNIMFNPDMRVAVVGAGTNAQLAHYIAQNSADPARAWRMNTSRTVTSAIDEQADAHGLLSAMDAVYLRDGFLWQEQMVLIAQGHGSRTTLAAGLRDRGATVLIADLYRRIDVSWNDDVWQMISNSAPGETAVVVTSTTVIDRLLGECAAHQVALDRLAWCTQHAAIAERLKTAGLQSVRRVRLDPMLLSADLFEHEQYW